MWFVVIESTDSKLILLCLDIFHSDEYLGLWNWTQGYVSNHWNRLKNQIADDPRTEIILPRSIRNFAKWLSQGDTKVSNKDDSKSSCYREESCHTTLYSLLIAGCFLG